MAEIARPPRKWYRSCIKKSKQQDDPDMNSEAACLVYWDTLTGTERASIWIEGLEYPYETKNKNKKINI